jgi:hypothetical protein
MHDGIAFTHFVLLMRARERLVVARWRSGIGSPYVPDMPIVTRICQRILAGTVLSLGLACSEAGPTTPQSGALTTDATHYTAMAAGNEQVTLTVITRYQNSADTAVVLDRCSPTTPYPIYGVELVAPASAEGAAYDPVWACEGHSHQLVVPAGTARTDTLTLRGPTAYDPGRQRYLGVLAGTFRVQDGGQESNTFTIQMPPGGIVP